MRGEYDDFINCDESKRKDFVTPKRNVVELQEESRLSYMKWRETYMWSKLFENFQVLESDNTAIQNTVRLNRCHPTMQTDDIICWSAIPENAKQRWDMMHETDLGNNLMVN